MATGATPDRGVLVRRRYLIIGLVAVLFLPPLSAVFQLTGDSNFCGSWCPRMFMVWRQGMTAGGYLGGFLRSHMGVVLVIGMLATTLAFGRYWCSHLCPVGGMMELTSRLVPRSLRIDFGGVPASPFRYGYLAVYLIAPAVGAGSLCCSYCNFAVVPRLFGAAFSQADMAYFLRTSGLVNLGLVVVLGVLANGGRAYCNLLCPVGALDAIANRLGAGFGKRVRVSAARCDGCGMCKDVCPTWAIGERETVTIDQLSCLPCRRCEEICPLEAITYGRAQG